MGLGQGVVGEEVKYYSEFGAFASDKKDDEILNREHKRSTLERMRNDISLHMYLT